MLTVNELLDKAKDGLSNLLHREVFLLRDLFKDINGTEFLAVIDSPYIGAGMSVLFDSSKKGVNIHCKSTCVIFYNLRYSIISPMVLLSIESLLQE